MKDQLGIPATHLRSTVLKAQIQLFWNRQPCGLRKKGAFVEGTKECFENIARDRYEGDQFMLQFVPFGRLRGQKVLEVGCGIGTDLISFARSGAYVYGMDFSVESLRHASSQLRVYKLPGNLIFADAESLPFFESFFDFAYSWGCLHHTPNPSQAISEMRRVLKPGGKFLVMLYHKFSLVSLQAYLRYGLWPMPFRHSIDAILASHIESPGTKAYTIQQAQDLFCDFEEVRIQSVVTRYDLRIARDRFLPFWMQKFIPSSLGWNLIIEGKKSKRSKKCQAIG